jgi:exopolysaccharide biosynthesis predicted pyruvyltransferase EpsI
MRYDAGVEEFLSLVKHAKYIVTNSYHGAIFATQMHRDFLLFSREQCDTKIDELLSWIGLSDRKVITGDEAISEHINYEPVDKLIDQHRVESIDYLKKALMVK